MRQVLIILVIFGGLYAIYYMYLQLQANNQQVIALQDQLSRTKKILAQSERQSGGLQYSLKETLQANQQLKTTGGSIKAFFSNIF